MRHIRLTLQYDGSDYSGWQVQDNGKTIQRTVEDSVFTVTGERTRVTGASRTDAGVHAIEQVASFKTHSGLDTDVFQRALNANLPLDIRVIETAECPEDFHPRYGAKSKAYSYLISTAAPPSPLSCFHKKTRGASVFLNRYMWQMPHREPLDIEAMKEASKFLIGEHDFSSFRASGCASKHPVRNISNIEITEMASIDFMTFKIDVPVIKIRIEAYAFLRHMVRNIVGTLVEVGRGKISPLRMKEILELRDRRVSGPTAPAQGLFLERIVF